MRRARHTQGRLRTRLPSSRCVACRRSWRGCSSRPSPPSRSRVRSRPSPRMQVCTRAYPRKVTATSPSPPRAFEWVAGWTPMTPTPCTCDESGTFDATTARRAPRRSPASSPSFAFAHRSSRASRSASPSARFLGTSTTESPPKVACSTARCTTRPPTTPSSSLAPHSTSRDSSTSANDSPP